MNSLSRGWLIGLSFILALILSIVSLPAWAQPWRPLWIPLVLAYWSMALPEHMRLSAVWALGLFVDILQGALLGTHAMGMMLFAYAVIFAHGRLRILPRAHQALSIGMYLLAYKTLEELISELLGRSQWNWAWWTPVLSSVLFWPMVFLLLRQLRRRYIHVMPRR